jgi:P4 family phage/plasmid primase-like protien
MPAKKIISMEQQLESLEGRHGKHGAYKPDDEQLAQQVLDSLNGEYAFFHSFWHRYDSGYWRRAEDIYLPIRDVLRRNRARGISLSVGKMKSVEFFVEYELKLRDQTIVDQVGNYLNFKNGMLNLDTMELEAHRKDAYLTTQLDFDFVDDALCPNFLDFLNQSLTLPDGQTDWQLVSLVQELIGYTLSADRSHRISVWLLGESNTGKSTLINALISFLKPMHITIDLNQLGSNDYLLAELPGKRLVTCTEIEVGLRLNVGGYKMLVSQDEVVADIKYRDPIRFVPMCTVWWAMNHTPIIADRTEATFNRVMIIPFNKVVPKDKRDFRLPEKLYAEREGIVAWALAGYQRLQRAGKFTESDQMKGRLNEFRDESDIYAAFLNDTDYIVKQGEVRPLELYRVFKMWCEERGIQRFATERTIGREWRRLGLTQVESGGRFWRAVSVKYSGAANRK